MNFAAVRVAETSIRRERASSRNFVLRCVGVSSHVITTINSIDTDTYMP